MSLPSQNFPQSRGAYFLKKHFFTYKNKKISGVIKVSTTKSHFPKTILISNQKAKQNFFLKNKNPTSESALPGDVDGFTLVVFLSFSSVIQRFTIRTLFTFIASKFFFLVFLFEPERVLLGFS